jgi:hypothetical protein
MIRDLESGINALLNPAYRIMDHHSMLDVERWMFDVGFFNS